MNYFLVDFENISTDDMKNLDGVREGDTIVMFFSENRKNISLDFIEEVSKKGANFKTMKTNAGTKNALDFQLTSYLGYLIGKYKNSSEYIIVSHDTGYDCLKSFWQNMNVTVKRASFSGNDSKKKNAASSNEKMPSKKSKVSSKDLATAEEINALLTVDENPIQVLSIVNQYKTKTSIVNGLSKLYKDTKKVSAVYKKLKPLLKEKNKS